MKVILHRMLLWSVLFTLTLLSTSCIFGSDLEISAFGSEDGRYHVSISTLVTLLNCANEGGASYFACLFVSGANELASDVTLTGEQILFLLFLDPLVLQLPAEAHSVTGSYFHTDSGTGGQLAIQTGLASIHVDLDRTLTAEPGTQLVVLDLPEDAPRSGEFGFNVNFTVPADTPALDMKALFTGRVDVNGETYYPPLLPCVTNMANVPLLSVPLPPGGTISLPADQVAGCENAVYRFGATQATEFGIFLPLIQK